MLSDSESESNDVLLTINEHYAKAYAVKKEREELGKLKEKYGSDAEEDDEDEEDSEDAESEDEDGEELTPAVDAAILRTMARIKRKDPEIYNSSQSIFEQEQNRTGQVLPRAKKSTRDHTKPLTMKQHALSSMLDRSSRSPSPQSPIITHDQEQNALRSETISAFHHAVGDNEDDGLFIPREKTKDEVEREEEEYKAFLEREVGEDIKGLVTVEDDRGVVGVEDEGEGGGDAVPKGKKKGKEKERQETAQEFLLNYIINRGWKDRESKRIPTYKEITHHGELDNISGEQNAPSPDLVEDDDFEDIADRFESSYNFRFEEPGAATILMHPRDVPSVVRRQDTTRKDARERRKQRKEEELLKKKEEVKRMKALKLKELRQKLEKVGREGGVTIDSTAFAELDLDGDWDPEKHDEQMGLIYDENGPADDERPQWDDDIDIDDIVPNVGAGPSQSKKKKKKKKKLKADDADVEGVDVDAMDADIPLDREEEEWDGTEEMRKRKVEEYMDEFYGMDFNDMVGDMPTRFKYTPVAPHAHALTPAEILLATDAELNEYMGIKKYAPYKKEGKWDAKRVERLKDLKTKLKERSWAPGDARDAVEDNPKTKKRKGKKERQRLKATGLGETEGEKGEEGVFGDKLEAETRPRKKRRKE